MKKIITTVLVSLTLFVASAFAFPPFATLDTFYDVNGNEIGSRFIGCTGGSTTGQTTGFATVEREVIASCRYNGRTNIL
jgi:hypothetical protein